MEAVKGSNLTTATAMLSKINGSIAQEVRQGMSKLDSSSTWWKSYFSREQREAPLERALMARTHDPNMDGRTPLHLAAQFGPTTVVKLLAETPFVDVNGKDRVDRTPLFPAAGSALDTAEVLLKAKADIHATDADGMTPLFFAARVGSKTHVEVLLAYKADLQARDDWGESALHAAAEEGNSATVKALLKARADVHATDNEGETPLHKAAEVDAQEVVEELLAARADVRATNEDDETPLEVAGQNAGVLELLRASE